MNFGNLFETVELPKPFRLIEGHAWLAEGAPRVTAERPTGGSAAVLFEDSRRLGPPNALLEHTRDVGRGAFRHLDGTVWFAASDNSDPNTNGRTYTLRRARADRLPAASDIRNHPLDFPICADTFDLYLSAIVTEESARERFLALDSETMLHWHVLALYDLIAARTQNLVLEIGAYVGGGTIALARAAPNPITSVECGGAYPTHPTMPSDDILADLKKNLARFSVETKVQLLEGFSDETRIVEGIAASARALGGIGLLAIDADGDIKRDIAIALPYLNADVILVLDDYYVESTNPKMNIIVDAVDRLVANKALLPLGVYGWGTWFGKIDCELLKRNLTGRPRSEETLVVAQGGAPMSLAAPVVAQQAFEAFREENQISYRITQSFLTRMLAGIMRFEWRGVPCRKSPFDLALFSRLLWQVKPRTIIDISSHEGGSALWLADNADAMGLEAQVIHVGAPEKIAVDDPRVNFRRAHCTELAGALPDLTALPRPWLVIEDDTHFYEDCAAVLKFFGPHLRSGEYIVVSGGVIDVLNASARYHGGPVRAVQEFLSSEGDTFEIDRSYCNFYGVNVTWNVDGYLKRK